MLSLIRRVRLGWASLNTSGRPFACPDCGRVVAKGAPVFHYLTGRVVCGQCGRLARLSGRAAPHFAG